MRRIKYLFLCLSIEALTPAPAHAMPGKTGHESCSSMEEHGLGTFNWPITTSKPQAQKLFNQGMSWAYGFHHSAAEEKFAEAAKIDPDCAMCYWGLAYVKGPNINAPMPVEAVKPAYDALQQAIAKAPLASLKEQAIILSLSTRYSANPHDDRSALDKKYAQAMMELAKIFPEDANIATLAVEARMDTMPWNYWTPEGAAREGTEEMITMLKDVLKSNPQEIGALHFLIHIVERVRPELAETEADRLVNLAPAAGHLQHMASHIYIRLGRYHDAARVNELAIQADQELMANCPGPMGLYRSLYIPHNYDFLIAAASLEGRQRLVLQTAQELRAYTEALTKKAPAAVDLQQFWAAPLLTAVKFADWATILREPAPPAAWLYARGLWHFARAKALTQEARLEEAQLELDKLTQLAQEPALKEAMLARLHSASQVLQIGVAELRADLAQQQKNSPEAIQQLQKAVALQDALTYIEPPVWYQSLRLNLGRLYQEAGRYAEAEQTYREDLQHFPKNGWALWGLYQSLESQQRLEEAAAIRAAFKKAFQYADVKLTKAQAKPGE